MKQKRNILSVILDKQVINYKHFVYFILVDLKKTNNGCKGLI